MAKGSNTPEARVAAAEHQQQVILLRIRGVSFGAIGKQLGLSKPAVFKLYKKALKLVPKADIEELRKLEAERIADIRQRLWGRLAGRPDPSDPSKTIQPTTDEMVALIGQAIRLSRHEAMLFGMDEPTKAQIVGAVVGQEISEEELEIRMARLTPVEQDLFMKLVAKLEGRWLEPIVIEDETDSVETAATTMVPSNGTGT
jgi:hypothetical protein